MMGEGEQHWSGGKYVLFCAIFLVTVVVSCSFLHSSVKSDNCLKVLDDGYWTRDGQWRCNWCITQQYKKEEAAACLDHWEHLVVIGGEKAKEYSRLIEELFPTAKDKVKFLSHPTLSDQVFKEYDQIGSMTSVIESEEPLLKEKSMNTGSLLVLHRPDKFDESLKLCKESVLSLQKTQTSVLKQVDPHLVIIMLPEAEAGSSQKACLQYARDLYSNESQPYLKYLGLPAPSVSHSPYQDLNLVSNYLCNSLRDSTCCVEDSQVSFILYLAISLIIATFAFYLGVYLIFASGATFALTPYLEAKSFDLNKFFVVLHSVGCIAVVLFYMQLADRLDYFTRVQVYPQYLFCGLLFLVMLVVSLMTLQRSSKVEILSHAQCNEWRGWMMILLLLLHFSGYEKAFAESAIVDFITGGFLFLTGFCHFSSFLRKDEALTWKKSAQVLMNQNFIPLCVCIALNSSYELYFLVPLLSLSFLLYEGFTLFWFITERFLIRSIAFILVLIHAPVDSIKTTALKFLIFYFILSLFPFLKHIISLSPEIQSEHFLTKIYFLIERHRFIPFWGMVFGYILSLKSHYSSLIAENQHIFQWIAVPAGLISFSVSLFILTKFQSSSVQTHFSIIPILSYVLVRNGLSSFHSYTSLFMKEMGAISVWLFTSHYHILLAFDGKGLFVLLPKLYVLNSVLVMSVFLSTCAIVSYSLHTLKEVRSFNYFFFEGIVQ